MNAEARNLEVIAEAIDRHDTNCDFPAVAILMNPFEVNRLGWEEIRGLPIVGDARIGTGRFRVVCSRETPEPPTLTEAREGELQEVA